MNFEIQKFCKGYCKFCKHINPLTLGGYKKVTILKGLIYHYSKSKVKRNSLIQKQPPEVFFKKLFLKISQNLQENRSVRASFLMTLQVIKKRDSGTDVLL